MGTQTSKTNNQIGRTINSTTYDSSGPAIFHRADTQNSENTSINSIMTNFTWTFGGQQVYLTGNFTQWQQRIPLIKNENIFSITIPLARDHYEYKFIVDGQWRINPQDPTTRDQQGNINNYIDYSNYSKQIIEKSSHKKIVNKEADDIITLDKLNLQAPKLPAHLAKLYHAKTKYMNKQINRTEFLKKNSLQRLKNQSHYVESPLQVQVNHVASRKSEQYMSYCMSLRFKQKYTTYIVYGKKKLTQN